MYVCQEVGRFVIQIVIKFITFITCLHSIVCLWPYESQFPSVRWPIRTGHWTDEYRQQKVTSLDTTKTKPTQEQREIHGIRRHANWSISITITEPIEIYGQNSNRENAIHHRNDTIHTGQTNDNEQRAWHSMRYIENYLHLHSTHYNMNTWHLLWMQYTQKRRWKSP